MLQEGLAVMRIYHGHMKEVHDKAVSAKLVRYSPGSICSKCPPLTSGMASTSNLNTVHVFLMNHPCFKISSRALNSKDLSLNSSLLAAWQVRCQHQFMLNCEIILPQISSNTLKEC